MKILPDRLRLWIAYETWKAAQRLLKLGNKPQLQCSDLKIAAIQLHGLAETLEAIANPLKGPVKGQHYDYVVLDDVEKTLEAKECPSETESSSPSSEAPDPAAPGMSVIGSDEDVTPPTSPLPNCPDSAPLMFTKGWPNLSEEPSPPSRPQD